MFKTFGIAIVVISFALYGAWKSLVEELITWMHDPFLQVFPLGVLLATRLYASVGVPRLCQEACSTIKCSRTPCISYKSFQHVHDLETSI
eukprot:1395186-Amphidinium_carterae.1